MKQQLSSNFKKAKGFTLIELIIVIIILGILAVTAAPKFIDVQSDARKSVMQGVKASIQSVNTMVHAKALIAAQTGDTGSVTVNGTATALVYGYPSTATIGGLLDLDASISNAAGTFKHTGASDADTCSIIFVNATSVAAPTFTEEYSGC